MISIQKSLSDIPQGIHKLPFIGDALAFRRDKLNLFLNLAEKGDITAFNLGPRSYFLFNNPRHVQSILIENNNKLKQIKRLRESLQPMLGEGLITTEGDAHKQQRKELTPFFHLKNIETYTDIITTLTEETLSDWIEKGDVDITSDLKYLTLRVISNVLFGIDLPEEINNLDVYHTIALQHLGRQMEEIINIPLSLPTPRNRKYLRALGEIDKIVYKFITEHKSNQPTNLLSYILGQRSNQKSDKQIRDELLTLFLAGHETTANSLIWSLYLLSQHPEIYVKMRDECDTVLAGRTPNLEDLKHLPYTLQVFKEAVRLYPPVYLISRQTTASFNVDSYHIPEGTRVLISPYTLHRRPDYFPDPERFDPDRFIPDQENQLPRYAYLPFGAGTRGCIGRHLAILEGHIVLATITQRISFQLKSGQNIRKETNITLRPRDSINLYVQQIARIDK